ELTPAPTYLRQIGDTRAEDRFWEERKLTALLAAVREYPERADLLHEVAQTLLAMGLYRDAASLFTTVIARMPENADAQRGFDTSNQRLRGDALPTKAA